MKAINTAESIFNRVDRMIESAIRVLPKSIIVKVVNVKKNTVDVSNLDLKASTQTIITNIPIIRPIYNHYPVQVGDLGICLTVDYSVEPFIKNSKTTKQALQQNANGSGYIFFPISSLDNDFASDTMANEMYSLDGKTSFIIDNQKVELKDKNNNEIVIDSNGIKITDANKNEVVLDSNGIKITDANKNEVVLDSNGIKITDANKNNIEMSSSAVVIKNSSCKIELSSSGVNINNGALEIMP